MEPEDQEEIFFPPEPIQGQIGLFSPAPQVVLVAKVHILRATSRMLTFLDPKMESDRRKALATMAENSE